MTTPKPSVSSLPPTSNAAPLPSTASNPNRLRRSLTAARREIDRNGSLMLMALPGMIMIFIFAYMPMPGLILAFKNYRVTQGIWGSDWVGLQNFGFLFSTGTAWTIIRNTLVLNLSFMLAALVGSLTMAVMLHEIYNHALSKIYQSILFFPHFISFVIIGYFTFAFLNADTGLINGILTSLNLEVVNWFGEAAYWPAILTLISLWKGLGYFTIIYLAGMLAISPEYYEAARIDGASKWQEVWGITLPLIRPLIIVNVLLGIGRIFYANFDFIYNVTRDASLLLSTTNVIDTYVFRTLTAVGNYNQASAAGFFQAIAGFTLVALANWLVRRNEPDQALF